MVETNRVSWVADYPGVQTLFYIMPIAYLLSVTLRPKGISSAVSLPCSALLMYVIRLLLMQGVDYESPNVLHAAALNGLLGTATPIAIIFGAIMLFRTMSETKCMSWMVAMLKALSGGHPVAEVMLISWAFAYIVEGASGFGTPVALAAPILAELGHDKLGAIVCCLIMNGLPNIFGAVGTPIWFGFSTVEGINPEVDFPRIAQKSQTLVLLCMTFVPFIACLMLIPRRTCIKNCGFIFLCSMACGLPSYGLSWGPYPLYEFGSLVGGLVGFGATIALIYYKVLLFPVDENDHTNGKRITAHDHTLEDIEDARNMLQDGNNNGVNNVTLMNDPVVSSCFPGQMSWRSCNTISKHHRHYLTTRLSSSSGQQTPDSNRMDSNRLDRVFDSHLEALGRRASMVAMHGECPPADNCFDEPQKYINRPETRADDSENPHVYLRSTLNSTGKKSATIGAATLTGTSRNQGTQVDKRGEKESIIQLFNQAEIELCLTQVLDEGLLQSTQYSSIPAGTSEKQVINTGAAGDRKETFDTVSTRKTDELHNSNRKENEDEVVISGRKKGVIEAIKNTFPIWGVVVLLILTRIKELKMKELLTAAKPYGEIPLGGLGTFRISRSVTLSLANILGENISWSFQTFYVPSILPFVAISLMSMYFFRDRLCVHPKVIFIETAQRLKVPTIALMGALVLVNLLQKSSAGMSPPATTIGRTLSGALGWGWLVVAPILGILGSFFSGSTTVANLTFGDIQRVAAKELNVDKTSIIALQTLGAALGNMVCINNILAARTVLGVEETEGVFIKKTSLPALLYYAVGTTAGAILVVSTPWWGGPFE